MAASLFVLATSSEALFALLRFFQFVDHCNSVVFHGNLL